MQIDLPLNIEVLDYFANAKLERCIEDLIFKTNLSKHPEIKERMKTVTDTPTSIAADSFGKICSELVSSGYLLACDNGYWKISETGIKKAKQTRNKILSISL